ncbi:hypothetical protein A3J78_02275 [Candidatus Beckwithbacteria bacterium RBG_13_35_6]|uniref:Endolytic murein transglycosylase n=1 Tax=Candidatus Beckwithbacteria bacterium RBG_13_35_6 TaxID=1797456 RepID=A0A1F5DGI1_9BACT|nr:MAG: hypothetical protein A3J78_02275 [Candidatus Beckwithbacteria bacterium RBG_13_35_6]
MFKKIFSWFLIFLFIISIPLIFINWWKKVNLPVDSNNKEAKIVVIPQGWSVEQIGEKLEQEKLIYNVFAFKLIVAKQGISQNLQAGDFRLSPSLSLFEIAQALTHGSLDIWVTIPEGLRKEEIAGLIMAVFTRQDISFDQDAFLQAVEDSEGMLFPDTYAFPKTAAVNEVVKIMNDNFATKFTKLSSETSLNQNQIVTLASIIEREAKYDDDRALVAGILLKRLKKGWPLEVDATLQYAKANNECQTGNPSAQGQVSETECDWWPIVFGEDKQIISPFNTYKNQGLPPASICNPGLAALKAAVLPQDSDYWFYLSDSTGKMHYAKTLEEHEANIAKHL